MPVLCHFNYCNFVLCFEVRNCDASNYLLMLRITLAFLSFFVILLILVFFLNSVKKINLCFVGNSVECYRLFREI